MAKSLIVGKSSIAGKSLIVAGLIGPMVLGSIVSVWAQDASSAQGQQAAPAAAPPPCSGLGCVFGAPLATQPAQPSAAEAQALADSAKAAAAEPAGDAPAKPKAKPQHPVTIAADATEALRLKGLVATLPKGKVKIVRSSDAATADFSVTPSLDEAATGEKAKLFTEQMHVLAGADIHSIQDLQGKVVSFGPEGSGDQTAVRKAFAALNVAVKETPLDLDNALDGLATGDVAAVVVLAPQPIIQFEKLKAPGLHLVPWPQDGALPTGAVVATIDAARYPGLAKSDDSVRAVGVDAILKISAKGARMPEAKSFLSALAQHSSELSRHGFDLIKADLESRNGRRFASDEQR